MVRIYKGYYCKNCEYIINKQKHQIDKKVLRQDRYFSTGLPYADKRIRKIWMNMINTNYNTTEDMNKKLLSLKGKTKLKFYINLSIYYDEMNIGNVKFEEDPFSKNAQGISKIYLEVILLMKFLQTKPKAKSRINIYYDLYYTVIKNRNENEVVNDQ